eukprot:7997083-Ditylum_brightwellii.AAC.1
MAPNAVSVNTRIGINGPTKPEIECKQYLPWLLDWCPLGSETRRRDSVGNTEIMFAAIASEWSWEATHKHDGGGKITIW